MDVRFEDLSPEQQKLLIQFAQASFSFHDQVRQIAGFDLPSATQSKFLMLHKSLTAEPSAALLKRLTSEAKHSKRDRLASFKNMVLGHVREGLTASYYHLANIENMERRLLGLLETQVPYVQAGSAVSFGGANRLDYEYQAFAFSLRRVMEYFATSVGGFFLQDVHRIRNLPKILDGAKPDDLAREVKRQIQESLALLSDVLPPDKTQKSVRDMLAHYGTVSAGALQVTRRTDGEVRSGVFHGGDKIRPKWEQGEPCAQTVLSERLSGQIGRVEAMIFSIYQIMGLMTASP